MLLFLFRLLVYANQTSLNCSEIFTVDQYDQINRLWISKWTVGHIGISHLSSTWIGGQNVLSFLVHNLETSKNHYLNWQSSFLLPAVWFHQPIGSVISTSLWNIHQNFWYLKWVYGDERTWSCCHWSLVQNLRDCLKHYFYFVVCSKICIEFIPLSNV